MITRFYDFLPIQRYEHFDVHVYRSLLHYGDLELLQCFIISIRQYDSESVSLYVSGASWMQRDAAIVTGLFVAANACFIIFSNHWFNVYGCKVTTLFPKNNGFQILWQHVADSCSGCLGCICSKGAILAVILHPKGKAMDGASISFREELRLDAPQRTGFPEQLPFGMGTASYEG